MCGGLPEFKFVAYVLDQGVSVVVPDNRPVPFDLRNHGSCKDQRLAAMASDVLTNEESQFFKVPVDFKIDPLWQNSRKVDC